MDTRLLNIIKIGKVSSVNGKNCTARVVFNDCDNMLSAELPIVTIGSHGTRGYWLPEVETQVLCLFLPNHNGNGVDDGFILGAFYSKQDEPPEADAAARSIFFADDSFIRYDGKGNLEINMTGNVVIKGAKIRLNCEEE